MADEVTVRRLKGSVQVLGSTTAYIKKVAQSLCGSGESCMKSANLPQVMSLESALVVLETTSLKIKNNGGVEFGRSEVIRHEI